MRVEAQLAGFGGQGIVLAGVILSEAALRDGRHVVQTQSYGPESRGGAARSDVVISDEPVDYPKVLTPDVLVTLSQPAFDKYVAGAERGERLVIVEEDLVQSDDAGLCRAPFTKIADELGRKIVANMVMLGYVTAASAIVSEQAIRAAITAKVPKGTEELNLKAFGAGFALGAKAPGAPRNPWGAAKA